MRDVLLGADPPVSLTRRAKSNLADWREHEAPAIVHPGGTLVTRVGDDVRGGPGRVTVRTRRWSPRCRRSLIPSSGQRISPYAAGGPDFLGLA